MKKIIAFLFVLTAIVNIGNCKAKPKIVFIPIQHATFVIQYGDLNIFVDPAGDIEKLEACGNPDLILITHTHGDHFNIEILNKIKTKTTTIVGNQAAIKELGSGISLFNREKITSNGIHIEAIAMYNTTEERKMYHEKGVGNGYILTIGEKRIYISGDTEDTKEVRYLKNIDHAFVCMNLPFTMTPEQAASAVNAFKPKKVYPYHYSQKDGFADIEKFKELVNSKGTSDVIFLDWYSPEDQENK